MANLESLIKQRNAKLLAYGKKPTRLCKCRYKHSCPLPAKCLAKCIACKAEVTATEKRKLYYGTSDGDLKLGLTTITASLDTKRYSTDTELPKYIWKLSNEKKFSTRLNGILLHMLRCISVALGGVIYVSQKS